MNCFKLLLLLYIIIFNVGDVQASNTVEYAQNSSVIAAERYIKEMQEVASSVLSIRQKESKIRELFKEYEKHIKEFVETIPQEQRAACQLLAGLVNRIMDNNIIMNAISSQAFKIWPKSNEGFE